MIQCCQCDRIAIRRVQGGYPLCVYCFARYQQAVAESQQANNEQLANLMAYQNYLVESKGAMAGLPRNWFPTIRIPQPIRATIQGGQTVNNILSIDRSVIGMLNTGQIRDVENININVSSLIDSGQTEVAQALKQLTEAVAGEKEISEEQRTELLDHLSELSNQAGLVPQARKLGIIKSVTIGFVTSLTGAGALAQLWAVCGDAICTYFGIENPLKTHP
jgi:hypothetical protein